MHINLGGLGSFMKSAAAGKSSLSPSGYLSLLLGTNLVPYTGKEMEYKEESEYDKGFREHYQEHIAPHFEQFETKRIEALKKYRGNSFIGQPMSVLLIGVAIYCYIYSSFSSDANRTIAVISLIIIVGIQWWMRGPLRKYRSAIKKVIYPKIMSFFGDYTYEEKGSISMSTLNPSDIIPSYDRVGMEDYIKGSYNEVAIELVEAKLTERRGTGKNRRTVTTFKGLFILLGMNKSFQGKTIVKRDAGMVGNWLTDKFNKLEKVTLEDPVFEKEFEVYSHDQIEARYLLTTSFMERLKELSELFDGAAIQCSFYDDRLLVTLKMYKNMFEPGSVYHPALSIDDIRLVLREISIIFKIIDTLKLDQKIGL